MYTRQAHPQVNINSKFSAHIQGSTYNQKIYNLILQDPFSNIDKREEYYERARKIYELLIESIAGESDYAKRAAKLRFGLGLHMILTVAIDEFERNKNYIHIERLKAFNRLRLIIDVQHLVKMLTTEDFREKISLKSTNTSLALSNMLAIKYYMINFISFARQAIRISLDVKIILMLLTRIHKGLSGNFLLGMTNRLDTVRSQIIKLIDFEHAPKWQYPVNIPHSQELTCLDLSELIHSCRKSVSSVWGEELSEVIAYYLQILTPACWEMSFINKLRVNLTSLVRQYMNITIIVSSTEHWYNDFYNSLVLRVIATGGTFVILQHGGYGSVKYSFGPEWDLEIADYFLHWGQLPLSERHLLFGAPIKPFDFSFNPQSTAITFIRNTFPKYPYRMSSYMGEIVYQNSLYLIRKAIHGLIAQGIDPIVRLYPNDYSRKEKEYWHNHGIITQTCHSKSFASAVSESELVIYTYNGGTGWISCLLNDFPFLLYFDKNLSPFSDQFLNCIELMIAASIFIDKPEVLISHILKYRGNIYEWWNSNQTLMARNSLKNIYKLCDVRP